MVAATEEERDEHDGQGYYEKLDPIIFDKLSGFAAWQGDHDVIKCPHCHSPMDHLFQISPNDSLRHEFQESLVAHISQCPQHKNVFSLATPDYEG